MSNSIFNVYNMVTAIAILREFGMTHEVIRET
jgi:UDP-N-acetylmuramyl tripeptide synthase